MADIRKLKTADQIKGKIKEIFTSRDLIELAKNHSMPHYLIHNPITNEDTYTFITSEIIEWFTVTCCKKYECKIEQTLNILHFDYDIHKIKQDDKPPMELSLIKNLFKLPLEVLITPPGIYFLCQNKQIVYVGKSCNVGSRISNHISERRKDFDEVYFVPCHLSNLEVFEIALIRHFKPKYNTGGISGVSERDLRVLSGLCEAEMSENFNMSPLTEPQVLNQ